MYWGGVTFISCFLIIFVCVPWVCLATKIHHMSCYADPFPLMISSWQSRGKWCVSVCILWREVEGESQCLSIISSAPATQWLTKVWLLLCFSVMIHEKHLPEHALGCFRLPAKCPCKCLCVRACVCVFVCVVAQWPLERHQGGPCDFRNLPKNRQQVWQEEAQCVCVCVCVKERKKERVGVGIRERGSVCACVWARESKSSTPSAVWSVFRSPACWMGYSSHCLPDWPSHYWKLSLNKHREILSNCFEYWEQRFAGFLQLIQTVLDEYGDEWSCPAADNTWGWRGSGPCSSWGDERLPPETSRRWRGRGWSPSVQVPETKERCQSL